MRAVLTAAKRSILPQLNSYPWAVPEFLCPILLKAPFQRRLAKPTPTSKRFSTSRRRTTSVQQIGQAGAGHETAIVRSRNTLPLSCPGCGAFSQTISPDEAGFYTENRAAVKAYLCDETEDEVKDEDMIFKSAISQADGSLVQGLGFESNNLHTQQKNAKPVPVCDRCHNLLHHSLGTSIVHPSIESIQQIISESPHTHNHIYHVLDAADFPMSLIPNLQHSLSLTPMRTQNRRSKHRQWHRGRIAEVSFIITRADLLAPQKEQVDTLMPYLIEVLRSALGRTGANLRMGNVRCVSAKRGWWTKHVKEAIWDRGGAGWMVGKVNVGKSNLFEVVFPKGRSSDGDAERLRLEAHHEDSLHASLYPARMHSDDVAGPQSLIGAVERSEGLDQDDAGGELLPPAQAETPYPVMPIISPLPGTTASPIRVPFGKGKGELIDLPGLERSSLERYVKHEHRKELVMTHRIAPDQQSIKPGQSLLLGGLIRITPKTPDLVFLAYAFVPLSPHLTSTEKAAAIQTGERASGVPTVGEDFAASSTSSAGIFQLKWDVTRRRTGPLTSSSAARLNPEQLPFIVYAADILIEGCGWVEIVAQVRKRRCTAVRPSAETSEEAGTYRPLSTSEPVGELNSIYPEIEVFSPEGKFIGIRPPMNGWLLNKKPDPAHARKKRPRRSMRSMKAARMSTP
ncbi:hypothetical protein EV356DRAFT_498050 [Viridothelium virens]|uniref:Genetic interactor of prohibitins 3, mitochondrial n=1 Tax=Viridothelium virens TaxID=1048519 RepID=A0A6A6HF22_VIRVR|nr:hypothetical protein EV356DRAFT_498050 [Viridothelium virens]